MKTTGFPFEYCDHLANAVRMITSVTSDNTILRGAVSALTRLGAAHNRWHVRDVLVEILQAIREPERALVALEGLQDVSFLEVEWSITDFAARSVHPIIREGVSTIRRDADEASLYGPCHRPRR